MIKIKDVYLKRILLILLIFLIVLIILKESKIIGFCSTILNLISPLFFGYVIAWLLKPVMLKFNKKFNTIISSIITYILLIVIIAFIAYFFIPIIIKEVKNIIPDVVDFYHNLPPKITDNVNFNELGKKALIVLNDCTSNIKNIILNIFYSLFISYYYLVSHKQVSSFIGQYFPSKLINEISLNLKAFVKGTLFDTLILFILTLICFWFVKMPYTILFAIIIAITNIIPFIGPYIGGIPAVIVAFSVNNKIGLIVLGIVLVLQFVESSFIRPIIMSKSMDLSPILIMMGLIIFGYFFGVIGMLISTPLVSIMKSSYEFYIKMKKKAGKKKELYASS